MATAKSFKRPNHCLRFAASGTSKPWACVSELSGRLLPEAAFKKHRNCNARKPQVHSMSPTCFGPLLSEAYILCQTCALVVGPDDPGVSSQDLTARITSHTSKASQRQWAGPNRARSWHMMLVKIKSTTSRFCPELALPNRWTPESWSQNRKPYKP